MGIGVLSMPYAMAMSGAAGVLSVALCCVLFCTSGKCIAWSMDRLPPGVPHSYPQLGYEAMGTLGQRLVTAFAILDLSSGSCLLMIVLWKSLEVRAPSTSAIHLPRTCYGPHALNDSPLCPLSTHTMKANAHVDPAARLHGRTSRGASVAPRGRPHRDAAVHLCVVSLPVCVFVRRLHLDRGRDAARGRTAGPRPAQAVHGRATGACVAATRARPCYGHCCGAHSRPVQGACSPTEARPSATCVCERAV